MIAVAALSAFIGFFAGGLVVSLTGARAITNLHNDLADADRENNMLWTRSIVAETHLEALNRMESVLPLAARIILAKALNK